MHLNSTIEAFYLSILEYAGLSYDKETNVTSNLNEKLGKFTLDDKDIALPYYHCLKNPSGKVIFHLLNESYTKPETALFNLYRKRLNLELNLKVLSIFVTLIEISSDKLYCNKIKNVKFAELLSNMPDIDLSAIENLLQLTRASEKHNDENMLISVYLKKNAEINNVPYGAIAKINFHLYKELCKALEVKDGYKVYDYKLRKKDIISFISLFQIVFPDIENEQLYQDHTDNKVFRYLNVLLKGGYLISSRVNTIATYIGELDEYKDKVKDLVFNHTWVEPLQQLYDMASEIRLIPSQTDITIESKLNLDESKSTSSSLANTQPQQSNQQVYITPQQQQPSQPKALSPEDVLKSANVMNPVMPVMPMQPPPMLSPYMPQWMVAQHMAEQQQAGVHPQVAMQQPMMQHPSMMQQPMMQQPGMMYPGMQQPMMQHPGMMQQPMMQHPGMMNPGMQQSGMMYPGMQQPTMYPNMQTSSQPLQLNPMFFR